MPWDLDSWGTLSPAAVAVALAAPQVLGTKVSLKVPSPGAHGPHIPQGFSLTPVPYVSVISFDVQETLDFPM